MSSMSIQNSGPLDREYSLIGVAHKRIALRLTAAKMNTYRDMLDMSSYVEPLATN